MSTRASTTPVLAESMTSVLSIARRSASSARKRRSVRTFPSPVALQARISPTVKSARASQLSSTFSFTRHLTIDGIRSKEGPGPGKCASVGKSSPSLAPRMLSRSTSHQKRFELEDMIMGYEWHRPASSPTSAQTRRICCNVSSTV